MPRPLAQVACLGKKMKPNTLVYRQLPLSKAGARRQGNNEIRDEMHDEMRHMLPNLEWILRASYASPSLVPPLLM